MLVWFSIHLYLTGCCLADILLLCLHLPAGDTLHVPPALAQNFIRLVAEDIPDRRADVDDLCFAIGDEHKISDGVEDLIRKREAVLFQFPVSHIHCVQIYIAHLLHRGEGTGISLFAIGDHGNNLGV